MVTNYILHKEDQDNQESVLGSQSDDSLYLEYLTEEDIEEVNKLRGKKVKEYAKAIKHRDRKHKTLYPLVGLTKFYNITDSKSYKNKGLVSDFRRLQNINKPDKYAPEGELYDFAKQDNFSEDYYAKVEFLRSGKNSLESNLSGTVRYTIYKTSTGQIDVLYLQSNKTIKRHPKLQELDYTNSLSKVNYYLGSIGYDTQYKIYETDLREDVLNQKVGLSKNEERYLTQYLITGYYSNLFKSLEAVYSSYKTQRGVYTPEWEEEARQVLNSVNKYITTLDNYVNRRTIKERTHNRGQYKYYDKRGRRKGRAILDNYKREYNTLEEGYGIDRELTITCKTLDNSILVNKKTNYLDWD